VNDSNEPMKIRPPRPMVAGIRKTYVRLAIAGLAVVLALALVIGLGGGSRRDRPPSKPKVGYRESQPEPVAQLPGHYAEIERKRRQVLEKAKGKSPDDDCPDCPKSKKKLTPEQVEVLQKHNELLRQQIQTMAQAVKKIDSENQRLIDQIRRQQDEAIAEQAKVWSSNVFFKIDRPAAKAKAAPDVKGAQAGDPASKALKPMQSSKVAFLTQSSAAEPYLKKPFLEPRSMHEIQAGTLIPAALVTGINTDLPGDVIASVTEPVYDTVSGEHELVPQGSKLYGTYDSLVSNGQNRALVVWDRLMLPNGRSIQLDRMVSTDASGQAGVADQVDYHVDKLIFAAALSTALAWAGNEARTQGSLSDNDVGDTVAQEGSKLGGLVIKNQLEVQPTITVRPGYPIRVMVNRDMILAPYRP